MKPVGQQIDKQSERVRETGVRHVPGPKWVFVFGGGEQCEPVARLVWQLAAVQLGLLTAYTTYYQYIDAFLLPIKIAKDLNIAINVPNWVWRSREVFFQIHRYRGTSLKRHGNTFTFTRCRMWWTGSHDQFTSSLWKWRMMFGQRRRTVSKK